MPIRKSYNSTVFLLCENWLAHFDCFPIWINTGQFRLGTMLFAMILSESEIKARKNSFDAIICSRLTISRSFILYIILYALSGLLYSHRCNLYALFHFSFVGLIKRLVYQDVTRSFRSYSFETNHHPWNARFFSQWFELHRCGYCGGVRDIEKFSFLFSNNFRYFVIVRGLN